VPGREPLVSIGVFVYNGERFLAQQLDSLLGQTLRDFELIISDNASTDRTAEICREYEARDARVRYIRQPANIGAPRNWNFVADQARGQYFLGASANDFYDARMLEKCVAALAADPLAVLCYGRTCIVEEDTAERRPFLHDFSVMDARPSERFKTVRRCLVLNNAQMGLIRLDVLRRTGGDRVYPHGDLVLTAELALHGRFLLLPDVLLYRRFGARTWSMRLTRAELQALYYGDARGGHWLDRWRRHLDYLHTVVRAPIPPAEKLRLLPLIARHAGGALSNMIMRAARRRHASTSAPGPSH
jgi:glycosyltransferase involved in cell wall biosynthesis